MIDKNIEYYEVIRVDISIDENGSASPHYVVTDKNGSIIKPADFPEPLHGKSFQLMKGQIKK